MIFTLNGAMTDFLILSIVCREDAYGYQISQVLKKISNTKDSALYPVLKRLQENQYVETYDQPFQGRNRKYYTITPKGREQYLKLKEEWSWFRQTIDDIVDGGNTDEQE